MAEAAYTEETPLEQITLDELIDYFIESREIDVHVSLPARVDSYDPKTQTVTCTPMINRSLPDGAGNWVSERLPQMKNIPVQFPRCRQFVITFPLAKGDTGKLVFCERNIGAWRSTGAQGDPGDLSLHSLDGGVFEPGLYPDALMAKNSDTVANSAMVIGSEPSPTNPEPGAGKSRIVIPPSGGGKLGSAATKPIARGPTVPLGFDGDPVDVGILVGVAGPFPVLFTYTGKSGIPVGPAPGAVLNDGKITGGGSWKADD